MIHNSNLMSPTFTSTHSFTTPTPNLNLDGRMRFTSENEDDFCRAMYHRINFTFAISLSNDVDLAMLFASEKSAIRVISYRNLV